jgi:DNA primase
VANTVKSRVWVCEGEFDSLILTQMGFPAVGIPGSQSFHPAWKYLFANCEEVSLVFDSDEAGRKGADRLGSILGDVVANLRRINLPPGMDVTDMHQADAEELKRLVS